MVGAYARDARAYFAAPWASWVRALRSALPRPLDRPLRPQTGETAPAQSPCCCCQQGVDEGASTTRWKARKARGWAGLVLLCTFGSAHSLVMALSSLAACFVHSPTQQQRPPTPHLPTPPPKAKGRTAVIRRKPPGAWRGIGAGGPRGNVRGAGCVAESQTQLFCDILYPNLQTFGPDEY